MVAPNGIYRLAVIGTVAGQQHVHTLHFRSTTAASAASASEPDFQQALIDHYQANALTEYRALFNQGNYPASLLQVRKVCGSLPLPGGIDEALTGTAGEGSRVSGTDPLAPWLANVTTLRTAYAGRSYRGRSFIGGAYEGDVIGATFQSGYLAWVTAYFAKLKAQYMDPSEISIAHKLFVFSRKLAETVGIACQDAGADVVSYLVRDQLATMKSRKAGSGL